MTAEPTCAWCGQPAVDDHHLTGRGPDRRYLDRELVAPLCHDCHELAHEDLRNAAVDTPPKGPWSAVHAVEFCLDRSALFLARLSQQSDQNLWAHLAAAVRRWADALRDHRHWLDRALPGWDQTPPSEETR